MKKKNWLEKLDSIIQEGINNDDEHSSLDKNDDNKRKPFDYWVDEDSENDEANEIISGKDMIDEVQNHDNNYKSFESLLDDDSSDDDHYKYYNDHNKCDFENIAD